MPYYGINYLRFMNNPLHIQLKRARERAGLSQGDLEALLNIRKDYISKVEGGHVGLSRDRLRKWLDALKCELLVVEKTAQKLQ